MYHVVNRSEDNMCSGPCGAATCIQPCCNKQTKKRRRETDKERGNRVDEIATVFLM